MPDLFPGDYGVPDIPSWIDDWVNYHLNPPRIRRTTGLQDSPEPGAPATTPPRRNYPTEPRTPSQAPRPRPGIPDAPLAGPLANAGLIGGIVKGSLIYTLLMQIGAEIFDLLPKGDLSKDLLNRNIALERARELENRLRRTGPSSRGGRRRPGGVSTDAALARPPPRTVQSVAPGAPGESRSRGPSPSPMAVAASTPGTGAQPTTAPVAPGTTTAPARVDPFARTRAILTRPRVSTVAPPLSPFFAQMQRFAQTQLQALADRPSLRRGRSRRQDFAPERPEPETPFAESPLTGFQPYGVGYDTAVDECGVKKRKPGKPRTVCYSGKYREKARGLSKSRGRKIPCQPSRSKSRS